MDFEQRLAEVREELARAASEDDNHAEAARWDTEMFKNGWPNCWGDFNNVMP